VLSESAVFKVGTILPYNCEKGIIYFSEMYLALFDLSLFFLKNFKKEQYKFLQAIAPFPFDSLRSMVLL
jgi:hypothetical protein